MSVLTFANMPPFRRASTPENTANIPEIQAASEDGLLPFEAMATPEPADALFALRAVRNAHESGVVQAPETIIESTEEKLYIRACAAMSHGFHMCAESALEAEIKPYVPTVAIVTPTKAILIEVSPEDMAAIEPVAEDIADSTGAHHVMQETEDPQAGDVGDDQLTPEQLKQRAQIAIAKAIVDERQAALRAKRELEEDVRRSEEVPALGAEELAFLGGALRAVALRSDDPADRVQARQVLIEYGMQAPSLAVRAIHRIARHMGLHAPRQA